MTYVRDVAQADFLNDVVERSKSVPVVVDFWAEWCGPCKTLGPMLERVTAEYDGAFELAKVDVDANQQLAAQMGVQGIPTVVAFVDGRPVTQFSGAIPEPQLRQWLASFLGKPTDPGVQAAMDLLDRGDEAGAEAKLQEILAEGANDEAAMTLAVLYIDQERMTEALEVLKTLPPSGDVERLRSIAEMSEAAGAVDELAAKLATDPDNAMLQVEYAKALAGHGGHQQALDSLLEIVAARGDAADEARQAMVDVFSMLGADHPLTGEYRRRLANALF